MSEVKLRECPHCGGEAAIVARRGDNWEVRYRGECTNCGATLPLQSDVAAAAQAWNSRTTTPRERELEAALRVAVEEGSLVLSGYEKHGEVGVIRIKGLSRAIESARALLTGGGDE